MMSPPPLIAIFPLHCIRQLRMVPVHWYCVRVHFSSAVSGGISDLLGSFICSAVTQLVCEFGSEVVPSWLTRVVTFQRPGRGPEPAAARVADSVSAARIRVGAKRAKREVQIASPERNLQK